MSAPRKYPHELRDRSVRLVVEAMAAEKGLSLNAAVKRIGPRVGVVQARIDAGHAPGTTSDDRSRIKQLEQDVKELKRANEILLAASSFFARELDPRLPW